MIGMVMSFTMAGCGGLLVYSWSMGYDDASV